MVMRPTPALPRYSATGEPRPPAPMTSVCEARNFSRVFSCPVHPAGCAWSRCSNCVSFMADSGDARPGLAARSVVFFSFLFSTTAVLLTITGRPFELVERLDQWKVLVAAKFPGGRRCSGGFLASSSRRLRASSRAFSRAASLTSASWPLARCFSRSASRVRRAAKRAALQRLVDHHVGHDATRLDGLAAWRVVTGGGQLDTGIRPQKASRSVRSPCRKSGCP